MSNKGRDIGDDNESIWNWFVRGIKPMVNREPSRQYGDDANQSHKENNKIKKSPQKAHGENTPGLNQLARSLSAEKSSHKKQKAHHPLDGKTYDKLRKGKMPIEGVLDMHGMTQNQAHEALIQFVTKAASHKRRCVLVITGKGKRSSVDGGVLRSNLPQWLTISPLNQLVLTHVQAKHRDGGEGAFYLYLKREKI